MSRIAEVARLKEIGEAATQGNIGISRVMYEDGNHLLQLHRQGDRVGNTNFGAKHEDAKFQEALHNAAPWLLAVAGQFQAGDAEIVDRLIREFECPGEEGMCTQCIKDLDCLRRMLTAAKAMEAEPCQ